MKKRKKIMKTIKSQNVCVKTSFNCSFHFWTWIGHSTDTQKLLKRYEV